MAAKRKKSNRDTGAIKTMWLTIPQAAVYAGVCEDIIRGWMGLGMKHSRLNQNLVKIKTSNIDLYLEQFEVKENDPIEGIIKGIVK